MKYQTADDVRLVIPKAALQAVFDECDGFDEDETGGRVIGTFQEQAGKLHLHIAGIIEAGPQARRSAVSFFQDGAHQERVFRKLESDHPEIEHLGNWHTHHVNGLQTLSGGDIETYHRNVNHRNHNTSFFYALLVTAKHRHADLLRRYSVKHYIFRRGDERVYEIPQRRVEIVDAPVLWPSGSQSDIQQGEHASVGQLGASPQRVFDRDILAEFYPGVRPFTSPKLGLYWRGQIELSDKSTIQVVLLEDSSSRASTYSVALTESSEMLKGIAQELGAKEFPSARAALITTERAFNRALYEQQALLRETKSLR